MDEGSLRVEHGLVDVEEHGKGVVAVVRYPRAAMDVDRHFEILDDLPQSVVFRIVKRSHPLDIRWDIGQQDAAPQAVLFDPVDVSDGVVDLIEEDLTDAGPSLGKLGAEVDQPTVMGPDAGQTMLVVLGPGRRSEENEIRKEGGNGVRKDDLSDDAISLLLAIAHLRIPVAEAPFIAEIPERVLVLGPPRVEFLEKARFEVLPVRGVTTAGMAVGSENRVVTIGLVKRFVAGIHAVLPVPTLQRPSTWKIPG
jgi:hypothetical protein